ncbi:lytic transglycosylase domain-containing protein [Burkholderia thailandensis]|uniref:BapC protein n=1 Tax=Burkholderia thailandensis (strain ATCC 700388 / DSM 13276 / CCUG 48851 / CIP 106301 / E264) TaxID=271848 RepID=Q2T705_BURTA|nr:lytic transglycosylase domain-containing protein [Burkholderia thailandensis]ABC34357.1 BapC protein [Burkholderia thailandensis E264]AHI75086.1 transglycosylase SLT domain protein [Burkholderia thailandensis 2002721723]AHI82771.1 transglycosylase SLT domain protein [Burkholderia thailandensis E444]AIC89670.1 transglycosylase SLT domain protein [Burkholderia thailandensis USAMRU Malaysia \
MSARRAVAARVRGRGARIARVAAAFAIGIASAGGVAHADCIDDAARRYGVNADLLRSIAYYESRLNPRALHRNGDGSIDIGLMQINSVHWPALREQGIDRLRLYDASVNARVGAALLRRQIDQYGDTWRAVGAYHSRTPGLSERYARAVHDVYVARPWAGKAAARRDAARAPGLVIEEAAVQ